MSGDRSTNEVVTPFDEEDDLDKELDEFIEHEESEKKVDNDIMDDEEHVHALESKIITSDSESDIEKEEKGQKETAGDGEKEKSGTDDEWDADDYNITEDQKRAMEELENQRIMDEEPPEYDVTERVKKLNEELKNDPTPTEKLRESRVGFKDDLVDLVAPPPDYSDDDTTPRNTNSPKSKSDSESKPEGETSDKNTKKSENKVLLERDGKFELVNADDVTADDMGLPVFDNDNENRNDTDYDSSMYNSNFNRKPAPPSNPRPSTANGNSRRVVRPAPKPRAQSAGVNRGNILDNFTYDSPYALSKKEKEQLQQQQKYKEDQKKEEERRRKRDEEKKQEENEDAFQAWLRGTRERERKKKQQEEEERKKNARQEKKKTHNFRKDENNTGLQSFQHLKDDDEFDDEDTQAINETFEAWKKSKFDQQRKEKLLKKRQEQEANEGLIIRSRDDCDKAFRDWLRRKNTDLKRAKAAEKQKARMMRIAARKARRAQSLTKAIRQSNAFRYVDYYGYRF